MRAAQGVEVILTREAGGERQAQGLEALFERGDGVVVDAGDASAAEVDHGERLERVIELRRGEINSNLLRAGDAAGVLEVSHAVLVEDDAAHGETGGGGFR